MKILLAPNSDELTQIKKHLLVKVDSLVVSVSGGRALEIELREDEIADILFDRMFADI